ncbi:MAG: hypothetical protein IJ489_11050 [Clostridia bacterium]|nr:hypothetical protein [Clostridia bacterium]
MKNRKRIIVAFLLVVALVLGVGYAALTDTLTIIGNATIDMNQAANNFDENVYFSAAEVVSSPNTSVDSVGGVGTDDATFTAHSLATLGDTAVFKFTILNDSNVSVQISIPDTKLSGVANNSNTNPEKFSITYHYSRDDKVIPSGETMDVTVTVQVIAPVTEQTGATFGIEYTATTVDG